MLPIYVESPKAEIIQGGTKIIVSYSWPQMMDDANFLGSIFPDLLNPITSQYLKRSIKEQNSFVSNHLFQLPFAIKMDKSDLQISAIKVPDVGVYVKIKVKRKDDIFVDNEAVINIS